MKNAHARVLYMIHYFYLEFISLMLEMGIFDNLKCRRRLDNFEISYMNVKYYEKEMEEGYTAADNLYSYTRWAILFLTLFPSKKIDYFLSGGGVLSIPSPV